VPATYLDRILAAHRAAAVVDRRPLGELAEAAMAMPAPRGFTARLSSVAGSGEPSGSGELAASGELAVIAEIKRRSPSKGDLDGSLDPAEVARSYEAGGAACLSVLTDAESFGGSEADLRLARAVTSLPVLRKDFTVSAADVYDTRRMGADAVLLIVAALDDTELRELHDLACSLGLDALVEVHDEAELRRALAAGATLVGVNQRDLATFAVDTARAERVAAHIPAGVVSVAESGIDGPSDAARLAAAGYQAVLVGESLVRSGDRAAAVSALRRARGATGGHARAGTT
jgi:indole-3-glycerol phosphate synthase